MIKKFHGHNIELHEYNRNGTNYIRCLIEDKERIFTQEEEVRQAIIEYILNVAGIDLTDIVIHIEHKSLDIVFYFTTGISQFSPSLDPALIIETKKDYVNLLDWEYQITNYLERNYCVEGLLLNSQHIFLYQIKNGNIENAEIAIGDVKQVFSSLTKPFSELDISDFKDAFNGDFNSFKNLVLKYGKNSRVSFACKGINAPILNAFCIKFIDLYICFDISGQPSRKRQNRIRVDSFDTLLSIT